MTDDMEDLALVVIGAGPAGLSCAIRARELGLDVVVLDENPKPGGQIYRQLPDVFEVEDAKPLGSTFQRGETLLQATRGAGIEVRNDTMVWDLSKDLTLKAVTAGEMKTIKARHVILASGAYDRPVPVPGWTLPGVFTVGGAQNLLKSQQVLVGNRVLLAGTGPLLLVVASQLAKAGAEVVVADPVPRRAAFRRLPALLSDLPLLRDGAKYHLSLMRRRAKWRSPFILTSISGDGQAEQATIERVDSSWSVIPGTQETYSVDAVCMGYGLLPSIDLARLAGCDLEWDDLAYAWVPAVDEDFSTSVSGLSIIGDGAGIAGAKAASEQGRIAAVAAGRDLGHLSPADVPELQREARRNLRSLDRFRAAMDELYSPKPGLFELAMPNAVVCRCEEVTAADIQEEITSGIHRVPNLKSWTRVTMGPCQGRMCLPWILMHLAKEGGVHPRELVPPRARAPTKPLPMSWF